MLTTCCRRIPILSLLVSLAFAVSSYAASTELRILVDWDHSQVTGCRVITALGNFDGVDAIFTTTYDVGPDGTTLIVTGITQQTCAQQGTVNFTPPTQIDPGGWPLAVNSDTGNVNVETYIPTNLLPLGLRTNMRWGFIGVFGTNIDTVIADAQSHTILFPAPPMTHRRIVGAIAGDRHIVLDGKLDDWAGINPLVSDLSSTGGASLRFIGGVTAYATAGNIFFNFAIQSNKNAPTANDDGYTDVRGKSLIVGAPGVLGNDFDPNHKPLTAILISGPEHGALVLNPDGSFTYANDGSQAPIDGFRYKANNGTASSNTAKVVFGIVDCNVITVTPPATTSGLVGSPFNQIFTQSGAFGSPTFTLASGTLPAGMTLSSGGVLSGTPSASGSFPITVRVTDANNCTGVSGVYNLTINCQPMTVTPPATTSGVAGVPFSQTFTQSGGIGATTFSTASAVPTGLTLSSGGVLSGTPTQTGSFPIVVTATDSHACTGSVTYTLTITCQTITVTNPGTNSGVAAAPFSQTFTQTGAIGGATFSTTSTLPAGLSLSTGGVLAGTPTQTGSFPIVVKVTDANGCIGSGATYTLTITCQSITVTNPSTTTGTVSSPFSQAFTASGTIGTVTFTTASTLPAGLTLSAGGVLSGTPTQTGTFPIVVTAHDANNCTGTGATYNLVIGCQTITVTKPGVASGTVNSPFSQTFTQTGAVGGATFTTASTLPTGLTLSAAGLLSGTPVQPGSFPIVVTVTDGNGCTGSSSTYTLVIACQTINVGNPATTSSPAGTPLSINFTQTGAFGSASFTTASTLPTGLSLATNGTLSGTPMQGGSFPIVVTVTDSNGCTGTNPSYTLTITCPTITVTNPGVSTGTAGTAFSQTFTQSGGIGTITWSKTGTLPTGITLNSATGVLSGTTSQVGVFPITVTATDQNGCQGTGATYNLTINCQTVNVTNPGVNTGTVDASFSQTFTVTGILGTVTWSETGALPAGITLNSATGVLSGTPTVNGSFPITVKATDTNGCFGTSSYTLTINCQTITVTKPVVTTGTVDAPFSQTFTQTAARGTATFTTASALPAGLSLSTAGVLSGTPTQTGSFPIVVTVTDSNGCTGTSSTYTLVINCQTITVTNPVTNSGTTGTAFSQTFTQSAAHGSATFTTASTLPSGFSLSTAGLLSGTTNQHGTFPIVVTVTDSNGCTGTGATYTLVINCQTITVTNPVNTSGTVASPFSEQFNQSGAIGGATFSTASTLPTGLTLSSAGLLSGTPTQSGSFPIVVTVTDSNGCTGSGSTYTLVIACNVITVNNPGVNSGTAGVVFSQTFTQSGGNGTITWSETGALPAGITLNTSTGQLAGTTSQVGSFPITVTATDANACQGTGATYTLTINCQTITVNNPGVTSVQAGTAFDQAFTATGILGTATWSETGALPSGITLNSSTGHLAGTTNAVGSFPITVKALDTNGCFGTSSYTLTVTCPTITVARSGGGSFAAATFNVAYPGGNSVVATGGSGTYTYAVTSGGLPTSMSLNTSTGAITGTPSQTGTYSFTVTATDSSTSCTGAQSFSIAVNPAANPDTYNNLTNNSQAVVTGGTSSAASTCQPSGCARTALSGTITANDTPAGGITLTTGTFSTTNSGTVTIAADGTFLYTPPVASAASPPTSDTFTYTITSNTGGTATPTQATGTVTLNINNRVWYVDNTNAGTADGRSNTPFNTLAAAQAASFTSDYIYVYTGDSTNTGQNAGITLKNNQIFLGQGSALIVNGQIMKSGTGNGTGPHISNTGVNGDAVTLADGNLVKGMILRDSTRDAISGNGKAGFTGDFLTVLNNGGSALHLVNMTGTCSATNSTWDDKAATPSSIVLDISGGSGTMTFDISNVFTTASGRTVSIAARTGGTITIGAEIHDNGSGILINNSAAGSPVITFNTPPAFGAITMNTGANTAVTIQGSTGTPAISFSGPTLTITTTTGTGFDASGAGNTLNVTGTSNITTGAAAAGLSLNGITIGGSGVTFNSVTTTGATTGINLVNDTGTVTVNGGTISNGTTGINMQGSSTSLSLAGVTVTGPTTGITNTTNFGTVTIGSSVNVSGVTALSLTTGNLNGTFANLSSTGGTNGVLLTSIGGTGWTATAGTLAGATGAGFKVDGGSANMTYGGSITSSGFLVDIGATTGRSGGTITFSTGTLGGGAAPAGTGIRIQNSTGTSTFTFSGTQTLGTSGSRMASTAVTLSGNNTTTTFNFSGTLSIFTGAVTAFTATGPTGGTINFSGSDSIDSTASALVLNGVNLGTGTLSSVTSAGGANGISLTSVTGGTLTISGGSLTGNTTAGFASTTSSATLSYAGSITNNTVRLVSISNSSAGACGTLTFSGNLSATAGTGILVNNCNAGTITFSGASKSISTGGAAAVTLTTNAGATIAFSGGGLALTTTSGTAFNATGGGTINVTTGASNNTVASTLGTAINISSGSGAITFYSVNTNGATHGINLSGYTGSLTVTGDGATDPANTTQGRTTAKNGGGTVALGSGGTIQSCTAAGVLVSGAATVTLQNMVIQNNGGVAVNSGGDGINASSSAVLVLDNLLIQGQTTNNGVHANGTGAVSFQHTEVNLNASNPTSDGTHVWGVRFDDVTGTSSVNNSLFHNSREDQFGTNNTNTTMTLNVTNCSFTDTFTAAPGNVGLQLQLFQTSTVNLTVTSSTFRRNFSAGIEYLSNNTSGGTFTVTNSTMDANFNGINLAHQGAGKTVTFDINGNHVNQITGGLGGAIGVTLGGSSTATTLLVGKVRNNFVGINSIPSSGSVQGSGIALSARGAGTLTSNITGNTVVQVGNEGLNVTASQSSAQVNLLVTGNSFSVDSSGNSDFGLQLVSGGVTGDTPTMCANVSSNTCNGNAANGGTGIIVATEVAGGVLNLQGYGGSANNASQIAAFLDGQNTDSPTPATVLSAGTIKAAPSPCPTAP